MTDFLQADITTDPATIVDAAVDRIATAKPGYEPNDGNLEVILLNVLSEPIADAATVASVMTTAAFRALGTKLFALPYNAAAYATTTSTWTLSDTLGHVIEAGTFLTIADLGFVVQTDVTVTAGNDTATVTLVATDSGTDYNALTGTYPTTLQLVNDIDWVSDIVLVGPTSGGADAEDDAAYQNRLASQLQLQAPRPITADNFAQMALDVPTDVLAAGVGRATAIDGYDPDAVTFGNQRTVTVFVTDIDGEALSGPNMTTLEDWLETFRELNFVVNVRAPTYTTIYVTFEIHVLPGYDSTAVLADAIAAVEAYLSPATWGLPSPQQTSVGRWLNSVDGFNKIRYNKLLGIIENTPGVDYVPSGSPGLATGTSASPVGTADITMTGPAPLPRSDTSTPTIIGSVV